MPAAGKWNGIALPNASSLLGAANKAWIPVTYSIPYNVGKVNSADANTVCNVDGTDDVWIFKCPLPTTKNGLKLYITGMRIYLRIADGTNYVTKQQLLGNPSSNGAAVELAVNDTDYNASGEGSATFAAVDCSSYNQILFNVTTVVDTGSNLRLHSAELQCYYA